jgi:hypothetical protein
MSNPANLKIYKLLTKVGHKIVELRNEGKAYFGGKVAFIIYIFFSDFIS